jgi:putative methionine-R-sulfoxide reductase with GAF domain
VPRPPTPKRRNASGPNDVGKDSRYLTNQESTGSELIVPCSSTERLSARSTLRTAAIDAFDEQDQALFEHRAAALTALCG